MLDVGVLGTRASGLENVITTSNSYPVYPAREKTACPQVEREQRAAKWVFCMLKPWL